MKRGPPDGFPSKDISGPLTIERFVERNEPLIRGMSIKTKIVSFLGQRVGPEPSDKEGSMSLIVYAIGHSTRPIESFVEILSAHSITVLVDVRKVPGSAHNPQFNSNVLEGSLKRKGGMDYVHLGGLGGLRRPAKDSKNTGWGNLSFRGYADYMQTEEFESNLESLIKLAERGTPAIMCAEGNPYRCHRSLIADTLTVRGIRVIHISSRRPGRLHKLTSFAKVSDHQITYIEEA
jgi:uncharacterized protein (DUF488 family)